MNFLIIILCWLSFLLHSLASHEWQFIAEKSDLESIPKSNKKYIYNFQQFPSTLLLEKSEENIYRFIDSKGGKFPFVVSNLKLNQIIESLRNKKSLASYRKLYGPAIGVLPSYLAGWLQNTWDLALFSDDGSVEFVRITILFKPQPHTKANDYKLVSFSILKAHKLKQNKKAKEEKLKK